MKLHSLRDHEPEAIRDDPEVIAARHELAADSQNLSWLLHPRYHSRVFRHYLNVRFDAEERLIQPDAEPYPPPDHDLYPESDIEVEPPYDWETEGVFDAGL